MKFQKGHQINLGRKCSQEKRDKISQSNKGRMSPMRGRTHSLETRQKISESNKGRLGVFLGKKHSEESINKIKVALTGRKMSEDFKDKCRQRQLGRKLSEETKIRMRMAKLGKKLSEETKEKIAQTKIGIRNPMFGKKLTEEQRLKISANLRKTLNSRVDRTEQELIHQVRNSVKSKLWRENIFKRDNFTCVVCGDNKGGNLEADHIEPFIKLFKKHKVISVEMAEICEDFWDISNGRTLCKKCHKKTPTWGSKSRYLWS